LRNGRDAATLYSRVEAMAANGDLGRTPPVGLVRRRVGEADSDRQGSGGDGVLCGKLRATSRGRVQFGVLSDHGKPG
jgi:hypothetical protein